MNIGISEARRLWLIDASYLFNAQSSIRRGFRFDYLRLKNVLEREAGPIWHSYYFNSVRHNGHDDQQPDRFHNWLQSAPPHGPKIITRLYGLKRTEMPHGFCADCRETINPECPNREADGQAHRLEREQQKGVDVGIATTALTLQAQYDVLLLSSGDSDLVDAINHLINNNKQFDLAVFSSGVSTELQARATNIYWLNAWANKIAREPR